MHSNTYSAPTPLPGYSQMMRWIIYGLASLQATMLALAVLVSHRFATVLSGQALPLWTVLTVGLGLAAILVPALALAQSRSQQHLGMALALAPLAAVAGLSIYLN